MKKSKIIFVNRFFHPDISATSKMLSDLVFGMEQLDSEMHVLASRLRYDDISAVLEKEQQKDDIHITRVWTTRFGRNNIVGRVLDYITFHISVGLHLIFLLSKNDVVIAKTDPPLLSVTASLLASLKKAKLINWIQDLYPEVAIKLNAEVFDNSFVQFLKSIRNKSLSSACMNVVLSEGMATKLRDLNIASQKIKVVHNWTDGDEIHPISRDENSLRKKWNLNDKFVVGYSGNMGHAHDFDTILNIVDKLKDHQNIRFVFIGDGIKYQWIESEIVRRRLSNVELHPYQEDKNIAESLSVADIHIVSLLESIEGLIVPSKFYSAAAVARPILYVGHEKSELGQLIVQANCGLIAEPDTIDIAVKGIINLENDTNLSNVMGANARRLIDTKFDKKFGIAAWTEILNNSYQSQNSL